MRDTKYLGWVGTDAVKKLRVAKLRRGYLFMINSRELASDQCYLEYPGGSIVLATLSQTNQDFDVVRELGTTEMISIRKKFGLEEVSQ